MTIDNVALAEGDMLKRDFVFMVVPSNPSEIAARVDFETSDGSAASGIDYIPGSGTLVFPPGTTSQTIAIPVVDETFHVNLVIAVTWTLTDG